MKLPRDRKIWRSVTRRRNENFLTVGASLIRFPIIGGQLVVREFWSTWCGPCVKSMPQIQTLHEKFGDRGVKVFGVNSWEESNAPAYFSEKKYTYGLLLNGETIAASYKVSSILVIYVIRGKGEIIYKGVVPDAKLDTVIEEYPKSNKR